MNTLNFQDKVVLITGGAKGVGHGISECYLAQGAIVVVCGRTAPENAAELPRSSASGSERVADFIPCDIRDVAASQALVDAIVAKYGRLDVLVNNAGGAPHALAATASPRFHEKIIALNLTAPLTLAQMANKVMQEQAEGGVIVFIGSVSALRPSPGTAAYGAAKAGVLSLVTSLAVEWAPKVRVVGVSPGMVLTDQAHLHFGDADGIAAIAKTVPMDRLAQPADIGNACVFLSSPQATYVSGSSLTVHGGGERPAFLDAANAKV